MSTITNMILTYSLDAPERLDEVNAYFGDETSYGAFVDASKAHDDAPTTGKVMEATVLVGAFNKLDIDDFVRHLLTKVNWLSPVDVRLFVQFQHEDAFHLFTG